MVTGLRQRRRGDEGLSLVEMIIVVALMGTALTVVFGSVQVLTKSAATNMEESASAHDLSYSMELVSKTLMSGRIVYANDYRVMVLTRLADGTFQMSAIYTADGTDPTRGRLVWERWGSDQNGTEVVGTRHTEWVMSDRNVNGTVTPPVPLFEYFKGVDDASMLAVAEKASAPDSSLSAFIAVLPGGYPVSQIGRIRLHVLAGFNSGMRDDVRDVVVRVRS